MFDIAARIIAAYAAGAARPPLIYIYEYCYFSIASFRMGELYAALPGDASRIFWAEMISLHFRFSPLRAVSTMMTTTRKQYGAFQVFLPGIKARALSSATLIRHFVPLRSSYDFASAI